MAGLGAVTPLAIITVGVVGGVDTNVVCPVAGVICAADPIVAVVVNEALDAGFCRFMADRFVWAGVAGAQALVAAFVTGLGAVAEQAIV
jgi:hypothetical protein